MLKKVIVGMSGGVDSAVSAFLLKKQGYKVIGIFMRNWDSLANNDILGNPNIDNYICPEEEEWKDVQKLGKQLKIEVKRIDFVKEYWDYVFKDLIFNYKNGKTPNPDILCNKYIKFGIFFDWISKNIKDFQYIATGHYAKIKDNSLYIPKDKTKDQTYFLAQVDQKKWSKTLFPLSAFSKKQVRKIASNNNLIVANKKDSTGICFIGERNFKEFLQNYIPNKNGKIINVESNKILGKHNGIMYYTIGQRKGLNLGGMLEPFYVVGYNVKNNIIYVAPQSKPHYLISHKAYINNVNWFDINNKYENKELRVKFRYKSSFVSCYIIWDKNNIIVEYKDGFSAVTPGQQCVFYFKNKCLGGGIIDKIYDEHNLVGKIDNFI